MIQVKEGGARAENPNKVSPGPQVATLGSGAGFQKGRSEMLTEENEAVLVC